LEVLSKTVIEAQNVVAPDLGFVSELHTTRPEVSISPSNCLASFALISVRSTFMSACASREEFTLTDALKTRLARFTGTDTGLGAVHIEIAGLLLVLTTRVDAYGVVDVPTP
jgi:hypothetical protein